MNAIPFPPSVRVPVRTDPRQQQRLNLRWSMARIDALQTCLRKSGLPLERIAELYQSTPDEPGAGHRGAKNVQCRGCE